MTLRPRPLARQVRRLSRQAGFLSLAALLGAGGVAFAESFPEVRCSASGTSGGNVSSYSPGIGGTAVAGDLILVQTVCDSLFSATPSMSGFSQIGSTESTNEIDIKFWGKVAAGGETTVTISHSDSEQGAYSILVVDGATWDGNLANVEITAASSGQNCPSVIPSWGGVQNLYCGFYAWHNGSRPISGYPFDLPDNRSYGSDTEDVGSAVATAGEFSLWKNPGSFSNSGGSTSSTRTHTVVVKPHASMIGLRVVALSESTETANTTTHDIAIPGTPAAGQLLLAIAATDGNESFTPPSGWQTLVERNPGGVSYAVFWKEAAGTESGTVTFATGTSEKSANMCYLIDGWDGNAPDVAENADNSQDPPMVSGIGRSEKIVIPILAGGGGDGTGLSFPTGTTSRTSAVAGSDSSGAIIAVCLLHGGEQAYDPGTYSITGLSGEHATLTVAVRAA